MTIETECLNKASLSKEELSQHLKENVDTTVVIKEKSISHTQIDFSMKNVFFSQCLFDDITFIGNWNQIDLHRCIFQNCVFHRVSGPHIDFSESIFIDCVFQSSRIPKANYTNCNFDNVLADNCDFNGANFSLSNYEMINFDNCKTEHTLLEAVIQEQQVQNDNLKKQLLSIYDVFGELIDLGLHNFEDASSLETIQTELSEFTVNENGKLKDISKLKHMAPEDLDYKIEKHEKVVDSPVKVSEIPVVDLSGYDFAGYNFQEHNLSFINFKGSDLKGCCFAGCDLSGCDFSDCDLTGAILFNAHFNQVIFENTILDNIILDSRNHEAFVKADILSAISNRENDEFM